MSDPVARRAQLLGRIDQCKTALAAIADGRAKFYDLDGTVKPHPPSVAEGLNRTIQLAENEIAQIDVK